MQLDQGDATELLWGHPEELTGARITVQQTLVHRIEDQDRIVGLTIDRFEALQFTPQPTGVVSDAALPGDQGLIEPHKRIVVCCVGRAGAL